MPVLLKKNTKNDKTNTIIQGASSLPFIRRDDVSISGSRSHRYLLLQKPVCSQWTGTWGQRMEKEEEIEEEEGVDEVVTSSANGFGSDDEDMYLKISN